MRFAKRSYLFPSQTLSIAEADLTSGPSNRLLKNEKKKVIVYRGIVVVVLCSVTESIVRLKVLKFSAAAFIALTVSWLLIRSLLTMLSVISFDRFTNSSVYYGVTIGRLLANIL